MRIDVDYCRNSLDKTGSGVGGETQHHENTEFAETLGITLSSTYTDNDRSAYSGEERPAYQRLLADIAAGKIGTVVIWHANRLHRSSEQLHPFVRLAREHKIKLYSTTKGEAYNLEKPSGRKQLRDDTSEAEYESEHRGERVEIARKRQARNGDYGGGIRPYGWGVDTGRVRSVCVNPKAPTMERVYEDRPVLDMTQHNEEEVAEIRLWAKELLAGVPMNQLLRDLAKRNVPTLSMKDERYIKRRAKYGKHEGWASRTIKDILTHPRTSGHSIYRGKIVKRNAFPVILEEDVRQALVTLLTDPTRRTSPGNTPRWLGSGIYGCGICMDGTTVGVHRTTRGAPVYRCRGPHDHLAWNAEVADKYVENLIVERLSRDDVKDLLPRESKIDVAGLREEMKTLDSRKKAAALSFARGAIDDTMLETISAECDIRIERIRGDLKGASEESPFADFVETDDAQQTWEGLTFGRKREICRRLLSVTLLPIGRGRKPGKDRMQIEDARTLHRSGI